jgi:hypothetical protein
LTRLAGMKPGERLAALMQQMVAERLAEDLREA